MPAMQSSSNDAPPRPWSLFSRHGHVLISLANDPRLRMRDLAIQVGVTERSVRKMIVALEESGVLSTQRMGRTNAYEIARQHELIHPFETKIDLSGVLDLIAPSKGAEPEE